MLRNFRLYLPVPILELVGAVLLLIATASCASPTLERTWANADLRALGSLDSPSPATDILAIYTRTTNLTVDIRIDLLDINAGDKYSLKLALWDNRDFAESPLVVDISSTGTVRTSGIKAGKPVIWPRVIQDYSLDTITVYLNRFFIGQRYRLDAATYITDPVALADEIRNIRSDGQPPVNRAPTLVAFWDAFPVTTPAQALRRWNGAHTGPLGDRHGLLQVLNAARQYVVPVALVDLKNPASLAALSFMGNITWLKDMYDNGLLILPDVVYGEPADVVLDLSRRAAAGFGLPASQFVYTPASDPSIQPAYLSGYRARFLSLADGSHIIKAGGTRFIPLPFANAIQATAAGLSLDVRRALVNAAISPDPNDLVVLGGSLPLSTWGDSDMVYPAFKWLSAHPWIQPLGGQDLLAFPARTQPVGAAPALINPPWLEELRTMPENSITQSAWQTYLNLTSDTPDPLFQALQSAYLGQVGELLAASKWAINPTSRTDCMDDLNGDAVAECILANQKYFAVLESGGARLTQFFYLDANGPHQIIGPSSQFAVGLSDPSEWHPERGEAADPSVIPGAFTDADATWINYTSTITINGIAFTNPDGSMVKTYRLTANGIQVLYQSHNPVSTRIPLAVDPQAFFSGPTNYTAALTPHSWTWSLSGGSSVEVYSDAVLSAEGFISAIPFLSLNENPNLEYPQGNYLPFPLSVVTIQSDGTFSIEILPK